MSSRMRRKLSYCIEMRIIIANKFYYRRGGDCVYTLNLEQLLKAHGHEVATFAMQYAENLPSKWSKYWPSEVRFKPGPGMVEALRRPFGTREVKRKFLALLDDFQPDVLHMNNIHSQLSPMMAEMAHERGVRVVWTIHDQKLLCPRYDGLKNGKTFCKECYDDKRAVVRHRCMKDSLVASWLAYLEAMKWSRERLEASTDVFVCPSQFMADRMMEGGFRKEKLRVLCNFIDVEKCQKDSYRERGDYYSYVGRLSYEKGTKTLIEAANGLPYKLVMIGSGPLEDELRQLAGENVSFTGQLEWDAIKATVGKARFNVLPSEVNENNPLSVIEAKCLGTPVLGARIGGIPELIEEKTGMTFETRNVEDLKEKIRAMWNASWDYEKIASEAQARYGAEEYYKEMMKIYG